MHFKVWVVLNADCSVCSILMLLKLPDQIFWIACLYKLMPRLYNVLNYVQYIFMVFCWMNCKQGRTEGQKH